MQLDADKEDQPFFKPQVLQTELLIPQAISSSKGPGTGVDDPAHQSGQQSTHDGERDLQSSITSDRDDAGTHDIAARVAAATISAEQDE